MYVSAAATGTQTTVLTTEHTLNSPAVAGRFKLLVDTTLMAAGDVLELRAKQIVLTGGTLRVVNFAQFSGAQPTDDLIKVLEIVDNELVEAGAVSFTMKQTFGTVHAYPWKVLNLEATPANISALSIDASGRLDISKLLGTAISTPATAGILDVNVKNMNNVAATSITTVSANQGTTQPVNFTGTGASALVKTDMVDVAGAAVSTSTAQIGVNAVNIGGTSQTGRDVGASVLLSSGTGTGQLDFTSGVVKANLAQILGTALTETSGQIAAAFKKFFDKATPTGTINSIPDAVAGATGGLFIAGTNAATTVTTSLTTTFTGNLTGSVGSLTTNNDKTGYGLSAAAVQAIWDALTSALTTVGSVGKAIADNLTGNAFTRLGAPVGASISADIAGVQADTDNIQTRLPTALVSGRIDASVGAMATDTLTSAALAASAVTEIQTGLSTLDAAGVRTAVGLASANLDTQLSTIAGYVDTEVAAIKAKTDNLPAAPAAVGDIPTATQNADALLNRDMSAVMVTNTRSPINALRFLRNKWSISGSTLTVTKEDDTTSAWTSTLTTSASADPVTGSDPA